jgi:hypothetical protein
MRIKIVVFVAASAAMSLLAAPAAAKPASQPSQTDSHYSNSPSSWTAKSWTAKPIDDGSTCSAEVNSFCSASRRGGQSISACLDSHMSELAEACKAARAQARARAEERRRQAREQSQQLQERRKAERAACGSDIQKFCAGLPAGIGVSACLKSHEDQLSGPCQAFRQTDTGAK